MLSTVVLFFLDPPDNIWSHVSNVAYSSPLFDPPDIVLAVV